MGSSGFSSPMSECFPAGLRVLVVDDDPTWLKILEKMLKKCNYEVTTCNLAREALDLLRERKDGFDIVISDVNMPDMDGFKLLEHVGLEMDLPVIMMSVDGETSRVMKGVQHGACDYLLKPIRMKELRNIWQHVFRKRIHEVRDIEGLEEIHMLGNGTEPSDDGFLFSGDLISGRKRKGGDNKNDDTACSDPSSLKKARVVWTVDLHQKFVRAVNHIGFDKVGPKKILDLMGVSWLTRENVASHLQKYRLYLSRLQKDKEAKVASGGTKHTDISPKSPSANVFIQKISTTESFATSPHKVPILEGNVKGESKKSSLFEDVIDPPKSSISFTHSFGPVDSEVKSEPKFQAQFSWNVESPSVQFKPEQNLYFRPEQSIDPMHHMHVDSVQPSRLCSKEPAKTITVAKSRTGSIGKVTKVESTAALFSVHPQSRSSAFEQIPKHNLFDDLEYPPRNPILATGSAFKLWDEEFNDFSSQSGDFHPPNVDFANAESFGIFNQELVADIPLHMFDSVNFDYPSETVEYQVMDQGLFIA